MKLLFYMDEYALDKIENSTYYVFSSIREKFNADICVDYDFSLIKNYDVIFCRFDRPSMKFLEQLSLLEQLYSDKIFINSPTAIMNYGSKHYLLDFNDDLLPPTKITSDLEEAIEFSKLLNSTIMKPVKDFGGKGIKKFNDIDSNYVNYFNELSAGADVILQEYISDVVNLGDKRINIVFYEPVNAVLRKPSNDDFICNLSSGGSIELAEFNDYDLFIVDKILPFLKKNNILWAGVDIIGPYLGEINITSPGLFYWADKLANDSKGIDSLINSLSKL